MRKQTNTSAKPVARLPYLVPPTNAEIDKMEIEASWQVMLENTTFPFDHFLDRIEDWKCEIELLSYELMVLGYCENRAKILNPGRLYRHPRFSAQMFDSCDDFHFSLYREDPSLLDFADDMYPHKEKEPESPYPSHWLDDPYNMRDDDRDPFFDYFGDHEERFMETIRLFGLKYSERKEVLRLYC